MAPPNVVFILHWGCLLSDSTGSVSCLCGVFTIPTSRSYLSFIHRTPCEQISVSSLARMCAVSETYFRKQFKKMYSQSPSQYIINLRLECASQLLGSGLYTVAETAEKSGFNDAKYFCRLFKKRYHYTPKEFRQITLEKILR